MDDHPIVRDGLCVMEQLAEGLRIVGEAGSLEEGRARVQDLLPHVVLLDLRLPDDDGLCIVQAVRDVLAGKPVFDPALVTGAGARANPLSVLSPGELRVLARVARGLTDKEVSTALNLSVKTVRHYLDRAFTKLGVHTRTRAAMVFAAHPYPGHTAPATENGAAPRAGLAAEWRHPVRQGRPPRHPALGLCGTG